MPRSRSRLVWLRYAIFLAICLGMGLVLAWPAIEILWTADIGEDFTARQERIDRLAAARSAILAVFLYTWFFFLWGDGRQLSECGDLAHAAERDRGDSSLALSLVQHQDQGG